MNILQKSLNWLSGADQRAHAENAMSTAIAVAEKRAVAKPLSQPEHMSILMDAPEMVRITEESAPRFTAVYRAVNVLADSLAQLPLDLMRRTGGITSKATDHALYSCLHDLPNPEITSFELRHTMVAHLCLWGNAYCEIVPNERNEVAELWPLPPWKTTPKRNKAGELVFEIKNQSGVATVLPADLVWRVHGLSFNGLTGVSPIRYYRQAVEGALTALAYAGKLYANNARPSGALIHPGKLGPEARAKLKTSWQEAHGGIENAHRVALLEEGLKWESFGMPPEDAQYIEGMKFAVAEVARVFGVPVHMLSELDRATFSNIEHQSQEFLTHSLMPWVRRFEQSIMRDLILPPERATLFAKFNVNGLLRADAAGRSAFYHNGRMDGWLSADDIRGLEDLNPLPNGAGQEYWQPVNMANAGEQSPPAPAKKSALPARAGVGPEGPESFRALSASQLEIVRQVLEMRQNGMNWGEIEGKLPGFSERTLRKWVAKAA